MDEHAEQWHYVLAPLLDLPELDLSVSIKSYFIRNRRIHQLLRLVAGSPLTFFGFILSLGIGVAIFFVPVRIGRYLGVIGLLIGLPGALVSIGNLRLEMVTVMLRTYDVWFSSAVSTIVSLVLSTQLSDARASVMLLSWLSFVTNICADASILGLRHIWIANIFTVIGYVTMAGAVSIGITDGLKMVDLVNFNGHQLPASAVVRDGMATMSIVITRNIVRKYENAVNDSNATSALFRCVSFRCRLVLRASQDKTRSPSKPTVHQLGATFVTAHAAAVSAKTKLRFMPQINSIDIRDTFVSTQWLWRASSTVTATLRRVLPWVGVLGFGVTNVIYLLNVTWPHDCQQVHLPIVILSGSTSTCFIIVTATAMQRQLLRAVATSFEFLFIIIEITIVHVALADILEWHVITVVALCTDLQWCMWILCWDAITPPVRRRLGLSRHFAAWIGLSLMVVLALVAVDVLILKPPNTIQDRVLFHLRLFNHTVEFRALSWYFGCVATISSWALRVIWRLCRASENELVVLDGTVVFEINRSSEPTTSKRRRLRVAQSPNHGIKRNAPPTAALAVLPSDT